MVEIFCNVFSCIGLLLFSLLQRPISEGEYIDTMPNKDEVLPWYQKKLSWRRRRIKDFLSYFWRRKLCDLNCQRNVIGTYHNDQPSLNGTRNHNHLHSRRSSWNLLIPTFLASKWFFFLVSFHAQNLKRWQCGSEHQHSWSNNKKLLEKFLWRENL